MKPPTLTPSCLPAHAPFSPSGAHDTRTLGCTLCCPLLAVPPQEELTRTLAPSNHDVLPALLEPSRMLEYNAQIYSQVHTYKCTWKDEKSK